MTIIKTLLVALGMLVMASQAQAQRYGGGAGGGHSFGIGLGFMSPSQDDLDSHINEANNASPGANINKFGTAYEVALNYEYRMENSIYALQFRPTYFTSKTDGNGYDYKLTGYTFFPILKIYALENEFIHFFFQTGVGYGKLSGQISQPGGSIDYSGSAFGLLGGIGAQFCFTEAHCLVAEGNLRYLPFERNLVDSSNGTVTGGITQSGGGQELEYQNHDLKTTMSGVQGMVTYQLKF